MIKEKKLILFLFLAFILTVFLLKTDAYAVNKLTNEELVTAKNNGIVSAMCYVQNLMTGAVAKSIMALSVLGVGWLFLLGGASWITVLTFTVATSLVFGGLELANIISGNNLSCQSILKAEEEFYETIYNKGLCGINKIPTYKTGQTWLACVQDNNTENIDNCPKKIDNDTYIEEEYSAQNQIFKTVVLGKCQEGYLKKDNNVYLEYSCKKDTNNFGFFKGHEKNDENLEKGDCKLACKESSLNYIYKEYNLAPVIDDVNKNIKILSGRLENGYYPQDAKLQIQCASGFITYFYEKNPEENGQDESLKEICFGGECENKDKFSLKCNSDGLFKPNISCRRACSQYPYKNIDQNVNEWGRHYKDNKHQSISKDDNIFIENDRVIIKNCKAGYMLAKGQTGLIGECRESQWWWDLGGSKCQKTCKKSYLNLSGDEWVGCDDFGICNKDISNIEQFAFGDSVVASGKCKSGYSISGVGNDFLKYTCAQNGIWENNNGKSCKINCKISDVNNDLPGRDNTIEWKFLSSNNNKEDVENGERIKPIACKTGYNVYADNSTIYVCKDGKFLYDGGPKEEYCKKGCKFGELKYLVYDNIPEGHDLTNSVKKWVECFESGLAMSKIIKDKGKDIEVFETIINLENANETNLFANNGSYYRIEECRAGYERVTEKLDDILVAKCSESEDAEKKVGWSIIKFGWNTCRIAPKCYEFNSSGSSKIIEINPYENLNINVKMQLWGAPGGTNDNKKARENLGGYSDGIISLKARESKILYVTVGEAGIPGKTNTGAGGFNGGGDGGRAIIEKDGMCKINNGSGGGGATDIRYGGKLLDNRIIVAGGGGGESGWSAENGLILTGYKGGGLVGGGDESLPKNGKGGTQEFLDSTKSLDPIYNSFVTSGVKGFGGHGTIYIKDNNSCVGGAGGGGGGYYGGSSGAPGAGGGGSGYINETVLKDGKTTTISTGPTNGGFARVCWGDWYKQKNPCDSDYTDANSYTSNAGITDNRTKCITKNDNEMITNATEECTSKSLIDFMTEKQLLLPEDLKNRLPKKYYKGMTLRQECGEGYIANSHKENVRVTFTCDGNNTWSLSNQGRCIKRGCREFKFVGADEPFEIPDKVEEVKMQVWGGEGGYGEKTSISTSGGGYSYGNMNINNSNKNLFVYVGAKGGDFFWNNGAGSGTSYSGGGATDIRTIADDLNDNLNSLNSRIIVAGGAGASAYKIGGAGGGGNNDGGDGENGNCGGGGTCGGYGGGKTSGGGRKPGGFTWSGVREDGSFGKGGGGSGDVASGGSGWYGGGAACNGPCRGGAGGGSGHLSGQIIDGTGGGQSGVRKGNGFARICWGYHPACDDTVGTRNEECTIEEYSCNDAKAPIDYNIVVPTTGTTVAGTSKVFQCKSGYTGTVKLWCGRDKWVHVSGECKIAHGCYEFTSMSKGKKLDMSNVNFGGDSTVKIQLWGARGGGIYKNVQPGLGGYSKGNFKLSASKVLYVFVGGTPSGREGGFNGGGGGGFGNRYNNPGFGGGGATDIRYGGSDLDNRIIVAGGGGGLSKWWGDGRSGFSGGGLNGNNNVNSSKWDGIGGGQTFNCIIPTDTTYNMYVTCGNKGIGGYGSYGSSYVATPRRDGGGGGGGGYYGGSGGAPHGGAGGSGYISDGVTNGQTTVVSTSPTNGGFARVCWGDWTGQTNPCDSDYTNANSYTSNAGITTNRTKCTVNPGSDINNDGLDTLPKCSLDKLLTTMDTANVNRPANAAANLPANYYEGMAVRNECKSGYSLVSGGVSGRVEFTCGSDGNWKVNGNCGVSAVCYEFTPTDKGKKLNMSNVNFGNDSRIQIQLWGAPGGGTRSGLGGYSKGTLKLSTDKVLYIFVGGKGSDNNVDGGFNGGGQGGVGTSRRGFGGGGATDIRYGGLTLDKRIIVAGGGGGGGADDRPTNGNGGAGGNLNGSGASLYPATGGSQTAGGTISSDYGSSLFSTIGVLGQGGYGSGYLLPGAGSGAGGGYYGGGGGDASRGDNSYAGGGGSGYIGGVTDGQTTTVSTGPTNGGFARICWGDWTGQTSPCSVTNHTNNAGITTNKTKCIVNPSTEDVVGGTLPACSLDKLLTTMDTSNVNKPTTTASNLPANYYEKMAVRNDCKSGYSLVSGGIGGRVEFTCGSDGNWIVNGSCMKNCTNPTAIANGTWSASSANHGGKVTLSCNTGYTLSGSKEAKCNDGNWSYLGDGFCGIEVSYVSVPDSNRKRQKTYASNVTINCDNGNFDDPHSWVCKMCKIGNKIVAYEHRSFKVSLDIPQTSECHKYFINASANIVNSNFSNTSYDTVSGIVGSGTVINLNCNSGYTADPQPKATCNNGNWSYSGSCMKNCTSSPVAINSGTWSASSANHGGKVTLSCNTGYTLSGSKTTTCNDGNWVYSGDAVCVQGACLGLPSLSTGSKFLNSVANGNFYLNGSTTSNYSASGVIASNGTLFDANCNPGYTEVSTDGDCTASQCGGQNSWGHYYYCQNGTWKRVGSCMKNCSDIEVYRKFAVNNKDKCDCDQSISCEVNTRVVSLEHGSTTSRSCDTGDTTKKCSIFCTTYHRRASGYCDVSCNNGVAKINCVQTRACSQGDNKVCN